MKTTLLLLTLMIACAFQLNAQDVIIKKNGEEISSKVLEISTLEIKYKKADYMEGPTYIIYKSDVFMIKYSDGKKEIISSPEAGRSTEMNAPKKYEGLKYCISVGYGFGVGSSVWLYGYGNGNYNYNNNDATLRGPYYFKFEGRISDEWSMGISFAYIEKEWEYDYTQMLYPNGTTTYIDHYHYYSFSGLIRANWHFSMSEKFDPYFGFGLGYRSGNLTYNGNNGYPYYYEGNYNESFPLGLETTIGLRYLFSKHIGAYTEAGIAKSVVQFGLVAKF